MALEKAKTNDSGGEDFLLIKGTSESGIILWAEKVKKVTMKNVQNYVYVS